MAIPYTMPVRDEATEEHYRRLEQLLHDLFLVLRAIFTGGVPPARTQSNQNQPPPPPPSSGGQGPPGSSNGQSCRRQYRGPFHPQFPVRVPTLQVSTAQAFQRKLTSSPERMTLQLDISRNGAMSVIGTGTSPAAPA